MQSASGGSIFKNRMVPGHKPETGLSSARVRTPPPPTALTNARLHTMIKYESKIEHRSSFFVARYFSHEQERDARPKYDAIRCRHPVLHLATLGSIMRLFSFFTRLCVRRISRTTHRASHPDAERSKWEYSGKYLDYELIREGKKSAD